MNHLNRQVIHSWDRGISRYVLRQHSISLGADVRSAGEEEHRRESTLKTILQEDSRRGERGEKTRVARTIAWPRPSTSHLSGPTAAEESATASSTSPSRWPPRRACSSSSSSSSSLSLPPASESPPRSARALPSIRRTTTSRCQLQARGEFSAPRRGARRRSEEGARESGEEAKRRMIREGEETVAAAVVAEVSAIVGSSAPRRAARRGVAWAYLMRKRIGVVRSPTPRNEMGAPGRLQLLPRCLAPCH